MGTGSRMESHAMSLLFPLQLEERHLIFLLRPESYGKQKENVQFLRNLFHLVTKEKIDSHPAIDGGIDMGRLNVRCEMAHTPASPHKNRVRRDMLKRTKKTKDVITISHGAFESLMMAEWKGRIKACDIDPGVRESISYQRESEYPDLRILPAGYSIQATVKDWCRHEHQVKNLGIVDVDLACTLWEAWRILSPVLDTLQSAGYKGRTFITFRNGRDFFSSIQARICWLAKKLPHGVQIVNHTPYVSTRIMEHAERKRGSCMCIVELKHN